MKTEFDIDRFRDKYGPSLQEIDQGIWWDRNRDRFFDDWDTYKNYESVQRAIEEEGMTEEEYKRTYIK